MKLKELGIDSSKLFQTILVGFVAVEIISWIISSIFPDVPFLEGGWILILFLYVILLTYLYSLGKKFNEINIKKDVPLLILIVGIIALLYFVLPEMLPELFPASIVELKETMRETISSIVEIGTGVASSS